MELQPRQELERVPIIPCKGFFETFNKLCPAAKDELKDILRRVHLGPYREDITDKYETEFELDVFTCYSSNGFSLEWHVETCETDDIAPTAGMKIFLTNLSITGKQR